MTANAATFFLFWMVFYPHLSFSQEWLSVHGKMIDGKTAKPLAGVLVVLGKGAKGTISLSDGTFRFDKVAKGVHRLEYSFLGYEKAAQEIVLLSDTVLLPIMLKESSLSLDEVVITARELEEKSSTTKVDVLAIEHLQATNLSEVIAFAPGGIIKDPNYKGKNKISMRQVGDDSNTAFGTAIVIDGVPVSQDASLLNIRNSGGKSETMKTGVDLRQIAADQIASVEIIRGIPSASYGNITSGVVKVETKANVSPFRLRAKANPATKSASISKGFRLSPASGNFHFTFGYLNSKSSLTDPMKYFERITGKLRYSKVFRKGESPLNFSTSLSYTQNLDDKKEDPETLVLGEFVKSQRIRTSWNTSLDWFANRSYLSRIKFSFGASFSRQFDEQNRIVSNGMPVPLPLSQSSGYHQGVYLPSEYMSHYTQEGLPVHLFGRLESRWHYDRAAGTHRMKWGIVGNYDKNFGDGILYDIALPPFPVQSSSSRPRAFKAIPASKSAAAYIEDHWKVSVMGREFSLRAGLRMSKFFVDDRFAHLRKPFLEPRINAKYTVWENKKLFLKKLAVRAGFGRLSKMPSLELLYPERYYYDIVSLNYFSQQTENNFLWIKSEQIDPTNTKLELAHSEKRELGLDISTKIGKGYITYFDENHFNGFYYQDHYSFYDYRFYDPESLREGVTGKPSISDFEYTMERYIARHNQAVNGKAVNKKGIEFEWNFKKIKMLNSRISFRGAWFQTKRGTAGYTYHYPSVIIGGKRYPYVGVYSEESGSGEVTKSELRTNLRWLTHIPELRLAVSLNLQTVWYSRSRTGYYSGIPVAYLDGQGKEYPFESGMLDDPIFRHLDRSLSEASFKLDETASKTDLNINVSWEASKNLSFSFLVNRLLNYYPVYTNKIGKEIRRAASPYFNAGMTINF